MRWTVLLPVKALPAAKSRLVPATSGPDEHRDLVRAIRGDTLAAIRAARAVARVLVVTDAPDAAADIAGSELLLQTTPGLNGALQDAAAHARARWPDDGVAALVGDLPALRPAELDDALARAGAVPQAFVPDVEGTGTTMLTALPGVALTPHFGVGSAAAHALIAARLDAGPGLRHDVDTDADLARAGALGLGPATAASLRGATPRSS